MTRLLYGTESYTDGLTMMTEREGVAVTASDTVDLPNGVCAALYVGGAGNINVNLAGGGTAVLTSLSAGQTLPIAVTRVLATSTTATGIVALYPADNL